MLYNYNQQRVIILIDEYDTPIQEIYINNTKNKDDEYDDERITFLYNIFSVTLKNNHYLYKALLTGILHSSIPYVNFSEYSMLKKSYSTCFGYTEDEVKSILKESDLLNSFDQIKEWYYGYRIHHSNLYNPWSINECIHDNGELYPYWVNTSNNSLIKKLLTEKSIHLKKDFMDLIEGKTITKKIHEHLSLKDLNKYHSAIWNLFYFTGYLTTKSDYLNSTGEYICDLVIPNNEVKSLYKKIINLN